MTAAERNKKYTNNLFQAGFVKKIWKHAQWKKNYNICCSTWNISVILQMHILYWGNKKEMFTLYCSQWAIDRLTGSSISI